MSEPTIADGPNLPPTRVGVAVSQYAPQLDLDANVQQLARAAERAHAAGATLLVAPEYASGFSPKLGAWMLDVAQPLSGAFVSAACDLAARWQLHIVFGMLERNEDATDARPFNSTVAIGPDGNILAKYQKVHLYDAFGSNETRWVAPGPPQQSAAVVDIAGFRVGLQTCYDLRFPEVSRRLVDAGANVLVVPAEWVSGPLKEGHWRTLLTARAIENVSYVVAADHPAPIAVGHSAVIDPFGVVVASLGALAGDTVAWLDSEQLAIAREQNPALSLRKYEVR